jgi:Arc/MetJ-type ribon-helix-helix transcriptional regulator
MACSHGSAPRTDCEPNLATAGSIMLMTAEPVLTAEEDQHLREMTERFRALRNDAPAELGRLYSSPVLQEFVRAVAELRRSFGPDETEARPPDIAVPREPVEIKYSGAAHKVSVSMPADLTAAVQQRVGRGKFSQYVTEAVSRQLERDLLTELSELLAAEHGPVPEKYLAEARAAWPVDE